MLQSTLAPTDVLTFALHKVSATLILLGLLFIVIWVIKNVHKDKLKKLSITLLVIGVLGAILASLIGGGGYLGHKKFGYDKDSSLNGAYACLKDDACKKKLDNFLKNNTQ